MKHLTRRGFTLMEVITAMAVVAVIVAIAVPAASNYLAETRVKACIWEIVSMAKEARAMALGESRNSALVFYPAEGKIQLCSDSGPDGKWRTADDAVTRTCTLSSRGADVRFGYPSTPCGSDSEGDGVCFCNNTLIFNGNLEDTSGTVHVHVPGGPSMAVTFNWNDAGYTIRRWDGKKWVKT